MKTPFKDPSLGDSPQWSQPIITVKPVLLEFIQPCSEKETLVTLRYKSLAWAIYQCSLMSCLCRLLFKFVQLDTALWGSIQ